MIAADSGFLVSNSSRLRSSSYNFGSETIPIVIQNVLRFSSPLDFLDGRSSPFVSTLIDQRIVWGLITAYWDS